MRRKILLIGIVILAMSLLSGNVFAANYADTATAGVTLNQNVSVSFASGTIDFGTVTISSSSQDQPCQSFPQLTIKVLGNKNDWTLNFTCTDFTADATTYGGSSTETIDASNLSFDASGGTITKTQGPASDNEPTESGNSGTLDTGVTVLTATGPARGTFTYDPSTSNLVLTIPSDAVAGDYTATFTATLTIAP